MTDDNKLVEDESDSVPAPCAPCNKCAFTYHRQTRKHERDIYRGGREHPRCAWHIGGVPLDILKCKKECRHYVEKQEADA